MTGDWKNEIGGRWRLGRRMERGMEREKEDDWELDREGFGKTGKKRVRNMFLTVLKKVSVNFFSTSSKFEVLVFSLVTSRYFVFSSCHTLRNQTRNLS